MVVFSNAFSSRSLVGNPRFGPQNPFASGDLLPNQRGSYLGRLLTQPGDLPFGFGDHLTAPISRVESQFTDLLRTTASGLYPRVYALQRAAGRLLSGTQGLPSQGTHGSLIGGKTGVLGALDDTGVFSRRTATSTSAAVTAAASNGATLTGYDVEVVNLATAQQNVGSQLLSAFSPADIIVGLNTIDVSVGGVTQTVATNVALGDTNLDALNKVASAINAVTPGVFADVRVTNDIAQLVVTGIDTGASAAFTLTDGAGDVVASTGIDTVVKPAQDALVRVDGVDLTSATNLVQIDAPVTGATGRVTLKLHDVTADAARVGVTVSLDEDQAVSATRDLLDAVNKLHSYIADKPDILTTGLTSRLGAALDGLGEALSSIGITSAPDGSLALDENALRQAIQRRPADVERTLGYADGLAAREAGVANTVIGDSSIAFATKPEPLGQDYARFIIDKARLDSYLFGGLFVNVQV